MLPPARVYSPSSPPRSAGTARILILIGLVLQAVEVAVLVLVGLVYVFFPIILAIIFLPLAVIGVIWIVLVYLFSYERVNRGDYAGARTPTLVFGILSLITFNLISGILYLVAFAEIGSAEREQAAMMQGGFAGAPTAWGAPPPSSFPPMAAGAPTKYCPYCGRPNPAAGRFCQGCGAALP